MLKLQSEQLAKQMLKNKDQRPRFLPDPEFEDGGTDKETLNQRECLNGDSDKDKDQVVQAAAIVFGETAANKRKYCFINLVVLLSIIN